jgi:DsbC/DsbD-like thiol-disulfide interchange protein
LAWTFRLIGALLVFTAPMAANAAGPAALVSTDHSTVRLFAAATPDRNWSAGLEIVLAGGWKTYWRVPGDSGVPPVFDWSASRNLETVTMAWPVPRRFSDAAGETIGYTDKVVFPLRVKPLQEGAPTTLDLKLFYAACNNICIPAEAHLSIEFVPDDQGHIGDVALIDEFTHQLPAEPVPGSRPSMSRLSVQSVGESVNLEVSIDGELDASATDIFVEGFDRAYFGKPHPKDDKPLASAFLLPIDGLKRPAELRGQTLTLTLVSGDARLVQRLTVN